MISTHALREEGDMVRCTLRETVFNFYPRPPRGGRLQRCSVAADVLLFLPTPSARRATCSRSGSSFAFIFLPTPSARRATLPQIGQHGMIEVISTHALREEGDQEWDEDL